MGNLLGTTRFGKEYRRQNLPMANMIDRVMDYYRGTTSQLSPLTILAIKQDREKGLSIYDLEKKYGIHYSTAYRIITGSRYPHFDDYIPLFLTLVNLGIAKEEEYHDAVQEN
jgi:hypothetical protein